MVANDIFSEILEIISKKLEQETICRRDKVYNF